MVPLLPDLGVLEWVRETKPLKAVVQETAKAKDLNEVEAPKLRTEWPGSPVRLRPWFGHGAGVWNALPRSKRFGGQPVQRYAKIFELPKADAVVASAPETEARVAAGGSSAVSRPCPAQHP